MLNQVVITELQAVQEALPPHLVLLHHLFLLSRQALFVLFHRLLHPSEHRMIGGNGIARVAVIRLGGLGTSGTKTVLTSRQRNRKELVANRVGEVPRGPPVVIQREHVLVHLCLHVQRRRREKTMRRKEAKRPHPKLLELPLRQKLLLLLLPCQQLVRGMVHRPFLSPNRP